MSLDIIIQQYNQKHGFESFTPKAVLFDMDGVLYNSMGNHAKAWHQSMEENGYVMSEADAYRYEGMRGVETIQLIAWEQKHIRLSIEEAQRIYDRKSAIFASLGKVEKMSGVEELMRQMKADGMTLGVVTGSGQKPLLNRLKRDYCPLIDPEQIVTSFDVDHGKPAPDPYLKGIRKCGVHPWEAIIVENAPLGVRAGVAAQVFTIAVNTGPLPDEILTEQGANLLFPDMHRFLDFWRGSLYPSIKNPK